MNTLRIKQDDDAVATYTTLEGAARAVAHLISLGYDQRDVGIAPRDFEVIDPHPDRSSLSQWTWVGLIAGAASMAVVAVGREIGAKALFESVVPLIAWGVVIGAAAGFAVGLVSLWHHRRAAMLPPPEEIAPTRYEVMVDRDRDRARHRLANWWDPAAPPAEWQQPA